MLTDYRIFDNLFDNPNITPSRFLDFLMFVYDQMTANNEDGKYDNELPLVKSVIDSVDTEINEVDTNLNTQLSNTSDVNQFVKNFGQFMKNNSGALAYALGGNTTAAFREFYPYKNEEYLLANRKTMPKLAARLNSLAIKYADPLGTNLSSDLQAFLPDYKKVLTAQRKQISAVNQGRAGRNSAFIDGQWTMTGVVHSVAAINSRNPDASKKLFPFDMLYPQSKPFIIKAEGKLAAKESSEVMNRSVRSGVKVVIANTSLNADAVAWLAMSPMEEAPATAVLIKANSKAEVKAEQLGNLAATFLMIKNSSDMNEVAYAVEITGLKKTTEEKAKEEKEVKEKETAMKIAIAG